MKKRIIYLFSTSVVLICMASCKKDTQTPEFTAHRQASTVSTIPK